jgi:hypothetical protein
MFVRIVKAKSSGQIQQYLRIVENYREKGVRKQRIIANLGNLDRIRDKGQIERLIEGLRRFTKEIYIRPDEIENESGSEYGRIILGTRLWEEIGIGELLREGIFKGVNTDKAGEIYARMMVLNRLCDPKSKLGIFRWLEDVYIEDWDIKKDLTLGERKVMVERFYKTMDYLKRWKYWLEGELYHRVRDLFSLEVDIIFYDITSTYFEGEGPKGLSKRGKSRDGKSRNKQILLGLVMCQGLPIAHHVFEGNRIDKTTVKEVVEDLRERFQIGRIVFVGDRGMVSRKVIEFLEGEGYGYIVALRRRRCLESSKAIEVCFDERDNQGDGLLVKEVVGYGDILAEEEWGLAGKGGRRLLVCLNEERAEEERRK